MKSVLKKLKWALFAILALFLLLVGAIVIFVATFDPNAYKAQITQGVRDATGRELSIEGEIGLTFIPLGFSLGKTQLSNAPGFDGAPFASVDEVGVSVAILPLLKNEVRIDRVVLRGLNVDLQRNAQGVTNWDDLVGAPAAEAPAPAAESTAETAAPVQIPTIWVGGVEIVEARVSWKDAQAGQQVKVDPFNLRTGEFQFGQPMPLHMDLRVEQGKPATIITAALDAVVTADPATEQYRIADLELATSVSGQDIPNGRIEAGLSAQVVADLKAQTATVQDLVLKTLGIKFSGAVDVTQLLGDIAVTAELNSDRFTPREVMKALAIEVPQTADANVLDKAELRIRLAATPTRADLSTLTFVLDDTTVTGKASVSDFAKPAIDFALAVDAINADRYLPPPADKPAETGQPAAKPAAADEPIPLPIETLRGLDLDGTLDIGQLVAMGMKIDTIHATVSAHKGLIKLEPYSLNMYEGTLNGRTTLDVRGATPVYTVHEEVKGVQMGLLQQDFLDKVWLEGRTEMVASLTTSGETVGALKRGLNGDLRFAFTDGAIRDEKLAKTVRSIEAAIYEKPDAATGGSERVEFTSMKGSATIRNGVASNRDLYVLTPILQAKGEGTVNLVNDSMDYSFGAAKLGEGERTYLYTKVGGSFANLGYKLDLERWAKDRLTRSTRRQAEEQVEQKEEEVKEDVRQKLEDRFKDLLRR